MGKVLKRLNLLNKHYPIKKSVCKNTSFEKLVQYGIKSKYKTHIQPDLFNN